MSEMVVRPAKPQDAPGIAACVCEAYVHYIERIGKQPGPMLEDYGHGARSIPPPQSLPRYSGAIPAATPGLEINTSQ